MLYYINSIISKELNKEYIAVSVDSIKYRNSGFLNFLSKSINSNWEVKFYNLLNKALKKEQSNDLLKLINMDEIEIEMKSIQGSYEMKKGIHLNIYIYIFVNN